MIKKTLKIAGIALLLLIGIAFAIPLLFKGKITNLIKTQINKSLTAKVDFSDVDLSLFRSFPRLAVALDSLRVTGTGEFSEDTLLAARRIDVAVNLPSLISGDVMKIHSINVDQPRIHAIVHKNGHPNWAITLPDTATQSPNTPAASKPFKMELQQYAITNAYISYKDDSSNMSSEIAGLNHSGSGDFTSEQFTLQTKTSTESLDFTYGGIPYLVHIRSNVLVNFQVDNKVAKYSFKVDDLSLNDLKLHTEGYIQLLSDSVYDMNISFNGPSLDFKNILSLVPGIYKKDFAGIKTSGQASLSGFVKGQYNSRHIPAYHVALEVKNGSFQYPDLPSPVKNINVSLIADNPDGVTDHTVVNIPQGHLEMDATPFDFRMLVKTPVSDPYIDAAAKGRLDLAKVVQFVKLESGTRLSGLLNADIYAKGNLSAIQKQQYTQFDAGGTIALDNFSYASAAYPSGIGLDKLLVTFNPRNVTLNELKGQYLQTHFDANGQLNNLLAYLLKNQPLDGNLNLKADQVNLDDWMGMMAADSATAPKTAAAPAAKTETSSVFVIPANLHFTLHAGVGKVHYGQLDLQNVSGNLLIAGEAVKMDNIRAEALDGVLLINGSYSTRDSKKSPAIALTYDLQKLDVQKTFYAFATVQKLMPAGKFIAGKFSSQFNINGILGPEMKPDLNSLNGGGDVLLIDGGLKNFAPTDKLAQTLHLDALKDIPVKDIHLSFSFRNGKVVVDPFHVKLNTIDIEAGGSHGFDQSMDYTLDMKMPRSLLGGDANALINTVVAKAGAKGIAVKADEKIDLPVKIGGTLTNPTIRADIKGALSSTAGSLKQQAAGLVQARVDSAKQQLRDTARVLKTQLVKDAGDELKKQLTGKTDTTGSGGLDNTKKKAQEAGKGLLNGLLNKKKSN